MAINETIVTGRKFRKCIDAVNKTWQRISFWTKSSDVEFEDGKNAETKLGAIDGITDSLVDTSSRIAASAKAVSTLNNNLGGLQFYEDETGNKYVVGADSVPKKLGNIEFAKLKKKTQTINSGRLGSNGYLYTFTANNLSRIDGITMVSARGYSTPSQVQDATVTVSIVNGNQIQFILPAGNSYYEYTGTVYQYIND